MVYAWWLCWIPLIRGSRSRTVTRPWNRSAGCRMICCHHRFTTRWAGRKTIWSGRPRGAVPHARCSSSIRRHGTGIRCLFAGLNHSSDYSRRLWGRRTYILLLSFSSLLPFTFQCLCKNVGMIPNLNSAASSEAADTRHRLPMLSNIYLWAGSKSFEWIEYSRVSRADLVLCIHNEIPKNWLTERTNNTSTSVHRRFQLKS